jgi:hypothetical protein
MTAETELAALLDELATVLVEERRALLGGLPDAVTAVVRRKLALAEAIERLTGSDGVPLPDPARLELLARCNQENAVICAAMLRHLTAAIDTLRRHDLHRSYRPDGSEHGPDARTTLGAA